MLSSVRDGQRSRNPCYLFAEVASLSLSQQTTFHTRANEFCHNFWSMPRPEPPTPPLPSPSHSDMCEGGCFTPRVDPQCGPSESAQMLHSLAYGVRPKTFSLRNDRAFALSVCGKRGQRYCTFVAMLCSLSPSLLLFVFFLFVCFLSNHVGVNFALHQIQGREAIISTEVRVCQSKSR